MDTLFGCIARVKHIYIPDGIELDDEAYNRFDKFVDLESISISSNHQRPPKDAKYRCEIRGAGIK